MGESSKKPTLDDAGAANRSMQAQIEWHVVEDNPVQPIARQSENEPETALAVRQTWLRMMGLSEAEIENDIRDNPLDLAEELANLSAMNGVQKLNDSSAGTK